MILSLGVEKIGFILPVNSLDMFWLILAKWHTGAALAENVRLKAVSSNPAVLAYTKYATITVPQ